MRTTRRHSSAALAAGATAVALLIAGCGGEAADKADAPSSTSSAAAPSGTTATSSSSSAASASESSESSSETSGQPSSTSEDQAPTSTSEDAQTSETASEPQSPSSSETSDATPSESSSSSTTEEPTDKPSDEATEKPDETKPDPGATSSVLQPTGDELKVGDSGPQVMAAQKRLAELGYFIPAPDGTYGAGTRQAVMAIQKVAGLGRDGVMGDKTRQAIIQGAKPAARTGAAKGVEIDLTRQVLMTVDGGKVSKVFNISSGNGEVYYAKGNKYRATTPTGSYTIYMERDGMHESRLELGSMYRPKYFDGGIAFHGSPFVPGFPASHGCVRVSNAGMDYLWDSWNAAKGTPVTVY